MSVNWRQRAACRSVDPETFFPIGRSGPALMQIEEAKSVCRRCPVTELCLQLAFDLRLWDGVFGGLTEQERRNLQKRRARQRAAEKAHAEVTIVLPKRCSKCRDTKSADDFPGDRTQPDGLNRWCRDCSARTQRERRAARRAAS